MPKGGFPYRNGESFRSDATAWSILTLLFYDHKHVLLDAARARLAEVQADDGSVSINENHVDAYWPTALCVLAWGHSASNKSHSHRAVQFLLKAMGRQYRKDSSHVVSHDTSIPGWAWIADTHSWVEPTALALCALRNNGFAHHQRVSDGVRLLLDRQLPSGGWNCGSTRIFGTELHLNPENTGAALQALAGLVSAHEIQKSVDYLKKEIEYIRTPIGLGWALLGLGAWGEAPQASPDLIYRALARQERYGTYDTSSLALLLLPLVASRGILDSYLNNPSRES